MAKITTPMVDVAAIGKVKWDNDKSVKSFFTDLGSTASSTGIAATFTYAAFAYADFCRTTQGAGEPVPSIIADAYVAGRTLPGGPGALSKSSEETYRSVIGTLLATAYKLPRDYGADALRDFVSLKASGVAFSKRGKLAADIVKAHPAKCPSDDAMKACIVVEPSNLSDIVSAVVKRMVLLATDDETGKPLTAHNLGAEYKAAMVAMHAFQKACAEKVAPTPPKRNGKTLSANAAALLS